MRCPYSRVFMRPRRPDAVDAAARGSTRLARGPRRFRDSVHSTQVEPEDEKQRMKTPVAKWVPRKSLSRKPKSAEAMELDKEEKASDPVL